MPTPPALTPPLTLASSPVTIISTLYDPPFGLRGDSQSGWEGDITFRVAANDVGTFVAWAVGQQYTVTVGAGPSTVVRVVPVSHPLYPALLCQGIRSIGSGGYTPSNPTYIKNWSDAKVTLNFRSVQYATDGQTPYMVTRRRAATEEYSLAGRQLFFAGNGQPLQADASLKVFTTTYAITIFQMPSINDTLVGTLAGCINSTTFLGWPAGFVRFDTMDDETAANSFGIGTSSTSHTATFYFTYRSQHWNKFLRPDCTWDTVAIGSAGGTAFGYVAADLNQLLA